MSAMIRIPIFPLPDVVLFPHTLLPLHIFEPRYRQMVRDCLAGDRRLAMALLKPGWENDYYGRPPVYPVAGAGEIIRHDELPDGRFNILVRGTMRIGITSEMPPDLPYRVARGRPLPDQYVAEDARSLRDRIECIKVFALRLLAETQKEQEETGKLFSGVKDAGSILDRIAGASISDPETRQRVLEAVDVPTRFSIVQDHLVSLLTELSDRNPPADRASHHQN
jgi:Lon protease-like protein